MLHATEVGKLMIEAISADRAPRTAGAAAVQ
jgi:hypothetical protein